MELVDPEVDLEELVHQEQQAPLLGVSVPVCVSLVQTRNQLMSSPATSSSMSLVLLFPFLLHQMLAMLALLAMMPRSSAAEYMTGFFLSSGRPVCEPGRPKERTGR